AQRRVPAGTRGDGAPAGVHAGEPGDARRGGDDPLLPRAAVAPRFVPASQVDLGPSRAKARYRANVEAIQLIHDLNSTGRPASPEGQRVLARWSSWGAIPEVFDDLKPDWDAERAELRELLSDDEWEAAARTTINAHYTDPMIARQVWRLLNALGFSGGAVLEPGSGAGTFIGLAPESAQMTGVELDPLTAAICAELYPHA